jgi:hypothetical protein
MKEINMERITEMLEENALLRRIVTGISMATTIIFCFGVICGLVLVCFGYVVGGLICMTVCGLLAGAAGGAAAYLVEEI